MRCVVYACTAVCDSWVLSVHVPTGPRKHENDAATLKVFVAMPSSWLVSCRDSDTSVVSASHGLSSELHQQRRARRAYRKRIAIIVCKKWIDFASDRLRAFRYHRRKLAIGGVLGFRMALSSCRRAAHNAHVLRSRLQYNRMFEYIRAWLVTAKRAKHLTQMVTWCHSRCRAKALAWALRTWHSFVLYQYQQRRLSSKADYFRSFILTSNSIRVMQAHIQRRREKALQSAQAVMLATRATTRRAWQAWACYVVFEAGKSHKNNLAKQQCRRAACRRALRHLGAAVKKQRVARMCWVTHLAIIKSSMQRQNLAARLELWSSRSLSTKAETVRATQLAAMRACRVKTTVCRLYTPHAHFHVVPSAGC
jgi:hypothetical protein